MNTQIINFNGTSIIAIIKEGIPYVAVRPICEAIGLEVESALKRIKRHAILGKHCTEMAGVLPSGRQNAVLCLPIQYLNGWLFMIEVGKVKEECRATLISYQEKCYQVLFDHFFGKQKVVSSNMEERFLWVEKKKKVNRLITKLMDYHKQIDFRIKQIDNDSYKQLGLEFYKPKQNGLVTHSQTSLA